MTGEWVEHVVRGDETLAIIIRCDFAPSQTTFVTSPQANQQVGLIVYAKGTEIPRHDHQPLVRSLAGTSECIVVKKGKTELTLYDCRRQEVCKRILSTGDVVVLRGRGHRFRQLEDTVLLEIKQGPYPGRLEKELF